MLYRWIDECETHGVEAFVCKGHQRSEDAELRKLRKENKRLKMEMEILKNSGGDGFSTAVCSKIIYNRYPLFSVTLKLSVVNCVL